MKNKKGFTLIELIVVLAILAIIMAIAVPTAMGSLDSARDKAAVASVNNIKGAVNIANSMIYTDAKLQAALADKMLATIFYKDGKWVKGVSVDNALQDYFFKAVSDSAIQIEKDAFVSVTVMKVSEDESKPCAITVTYSKEGYTGSGLTTKPKYPYYRTAIAEGVYNKYLSEGVFIEIK